MIMEQNAKAKEKESFLELIEQLDTGYSLAEAFENGKNFGNYERLAIEIGEKTGHLPSGPAISRLLPKTQRT
ncbi:hypothetical protein [Aureicoccus marinus]|uniref:hypothetical protein n=1 Tax=Aureicoccus marinus TaxID=754435 RepID=UPI0021D35AA2|nr:hypothetical protein [Aureicoccus marinus]